MTRVPSSTTDRAAAPQAFKDGLGTRERAPDQGGDAVEHLHLVQEVAQQESAIRDRVGRLINFRHARYVRLRGVDRAKGGTRALYVAYDALEGRRLSSVLEALPKMALSIEVDVALQIIRDLLPAIGILHDSRKVTHGCIAPERLVYTTQQRLVIVDHGFGAALQRLNLPRKKLWEQYRIASPAPNRAVFDEKTDIVQIGLVALALLLGRPLAEDEYPVQVKRLIFSIKEQSSRIGSRPIGPELRRWLERATAIDEAQTFSSIKEAQDAFETVVAVERYAPTAASVKSFFARYEELSPKAAPVVEAEDVTPTAKSPSARSSGAVDVDSALAGLDMQLTIGRRRTAAADPTPAVAVEVTLPLKAKAKPEAKPEPVPEVAAEAVAPAPDLKFGRRKSDRLDALQALQEEMSLAAGDGDVSALEQTANAVYQDAASRVTGRPVADDSERVAREAAERARQEAETREQAEREGRALAEQVARDAAEQVAREAADRAAAERQAHAASEREALERGARQEAERQAHEASLRAIREAAERETAERAARDASVREEVEREARLRLERDHREAAERRAQEQAERDAAEQVARARREEEGREREARVVAEREAAARAAREAAERAERAEREGAAREAAERQAREHAEREAKAAAQRAAKESADRAAAEKAARDAAERAERAERLAADRAEQAAREAVDRTQREAAAREAAERQARERAEREAKAAAERAAKESADRLTAEKAARAAAERAEREAAERAEERAAAERAARESAGREAAHRAARELAEQAVLEAAERETAHRAALEAAEQAVREAAERAAVERAAREAAEQAAREASERALADLVARHAGDRGEFEAAGRVAAERAAREHAFAAETERTARALAEREVREMTTRAQHEAAERAAAERAALEHAARAEAEREARGAAEREARKAAERAAREAAERHAAERAAREAAALMEAERQARAAAELRANEASEHAAREAASREAAERAARVAQANEGIGRRRRKKRLGQRTPEEVDAVQPLPSMTEEAQAAQAALPPVDTSNGAPMFQWQPGQSVDVLPAWARGASAGEPAEPAAAVPEAVSYTPPPADPYAYHPLPAAEPAPASASILPFKPPQADTWMHRAPQAMDPVVEPESRAIAPGPTQAPRRRSRINWARTLAASLLVALLEGVAFATAWWYVTPEQQGWLVVHTKPAGIQVAVDGTLLGQTPFAKALAPGRHTIELRYGTATRVVPVEISAGVQTEQRISWGNGFNSGQASITSTNPGSRVSIDGRHMGKTPLTVSDLLPGKHEVTVEGDTGTVSTMLIVEAGETTELDVPVYAGWVSVLSPVQLEILLDGKLIGSTEIEKLMLKPGRHKLQLENDSLGYKNTVEVRVRPGATTSVSVVPKAPVTVEAPEGTELSINGENMGTLPNPTLEVPLGTAEFVMRYKDEERRMVVPATMLSPVVVKFETATPVERERR